MASLAEPFTYDLPASLIAQRPVQPADQAKLLVIDRSRHTLRDSTFVEFPAFLRPGDLLVFNDTKVVPARFFGRLKQDAQADVPVEVFLVRRQVEGDIDASRHVWVCIGRPLKRFQPSSTIAFEQGLKARVLSRPSSDEAVLEFYAESRADVGDLMHHVGSMPIPPYIRDGRSDEQDRSDYQTIFAQAEGSIAAPTASLHFTRELMERIEARGAQVAFLTLHVGAASIRPVLRDGQIQAPSAEHMRVSSQLFSQIAVTKMSGGRVIGVGTTVTRALESGARFFARGTNSVDEVIEVDTDLFITPGFEFKVIDGLVTNFHQPGTTHLLLVEAFMGRELLSNSYRRAIEQQYRFLSYGDGCLIL